MGDFGNAGKRIVHKNLDAVLVSAGKKEYLSYKLTAQGAEPVFTFACMHQPLRSENEFPGHPKQTYEWTWCKTNDPDTLPSDAEDDMYVVALSFITAVKYSLVVEHHRSDDSIIQTIKDIDYTSQDPNDRFRETLRVFYI